MTYDVLRNVTYDVTFNETYNVTYNTTINVTEYVNVTTEVTSTYNVTSQQPVDVVVALDASWSVSDADWAVENTAGRELLRGLRNTLASDLRAGVAVWANDGVMRQALTHVDDEATIDAMADVQRLPYCVAVPEPHSARAEQFSSHLCEGDPPRVQDEDHAYDLRHDAAQVWGLATGTYYAQALLQCHAAFQASGDDAFKLCVVVTDGQIDEDKYAQCDADGRRSTMTYTSSMAGDYYDAGAEIFVDDGGGCGSQADVRWVAPGASAFCAEYDLAACTVDAIAAALQALGVKVLNVLVSANDDLAVPNTNTPEGAPQ